MAAFGTMLAQHILFRSLLLLLTIFYVQTTSISNLKKCADKTCSATISRATALARYPANSPLHLSLVRGDIIEIKSKSAGNKPELWSGEVFRTGRKGYFPKSFVREFEVVIDNPTFEVPTEEDVWDNKPKQPPPEMPPPAEAKDVKDETEIDETDLTDLDSEHEKTTQETQPSLEQSVSSPDATPDESADKQTETKDEDTQAQKRDPLFYNIEELQKSFSKMNEIHHDAEAQMNGPILHSIEVFRKSIAEMNEVHHDTEAFNNFLSSQFGSKDTAFASVPEKSEPSEDSPKQESDLNDDKMGGATDNPEPVSDSDSAKQEFVTKPDDAGAGLDNTNIGSSDTQPSPVDPVDSNTGEVKTEEKEAKVLKEKKEVEESPYIAGVSVLEDEEEEDEGYEEEEEEQEELSQEDSPLQEDASMEPEKTEEIATKTSASAHTQDAVIQTESEDPTEVGEDVKEQAAQQAPGSSDQQSAVNTNAEKMGKPESPALSKDNIVDPGRMAEEMEAIKQVIKDLPNGLLGGALDQEAGDKPKLQDSMESSLPLHVEAPKDSTTGTGDKLQPQDAVEGSRPPHIEVPKDSTAGTGADSVKQDLDQEKLKFQSEKLKEEAEAHIQSENSKEDVKHMVQHEEVKEPVANKESSPGLHPESVETASELELQGEGSEKASTPLKQQDEQESAKEQPVIQPDKTLPTSPAPPVHQPVHIDFVAGQVQDSNTPLESSQSIMEQHHPAHTPALEDTAPSIKQAAPGIHDIGNTAVPPVKTEAHAGESDVDNQKPTTMIDGTRFYLEDGEIADIVPESVPVQDATTKIPPPAEPEMSSPPESAESSVQPTATTMMPEMSTPPVPEETLPFQGATTVAPTPQILEAAPQTGQNSTEGAAGTTDASPEKPNIPDVDSHVTISGHEYHTNADFLGRKVLSVNSQATGQAAPSPEEKAQPVPAPDQVVKETTDQESNTQAVEGSSEQPPATHNSAQVEMPPAKEMQPSASENAGQPSVTIEGEGEATGEQAHHRTSDEQAAKPASEPAAEHDSKTKDEADKGGSSSQNVEAGPGAADSVTPTPNPLDWDDVPPPSAADVTPSSPDTVEEEPTLDGDPYQMDDYYSRKINDEELSKAEEEAAAYASGTVGSLDAQSKAFIDRLPPSIQSLLEQEPLGLSPGMTVLVTMTALVIFLSVTCFSCLCTPSGKKAGTKDPLVVVRELEEKLLIAVKEKENLEDILQERQTENKRLKAEYSDLQSRSGTAKTDLHTITLHNEVLKNQITTFQAEIAELKEQLSRKSDDIKSKDKKSKESEKEAKKLQEVKQKMEQNLQKKENERQRLADENENLKTTVQSLTDRVQCLDTSKQQLLSEAEDWKEKVDELKESLSQVEQENRQAQETITFKDNELEVMKDCYLQLKSFEKPSQEGGEDEDFDAGSSEDKQEKIKAMMDVTKVNATLRAVQEEKDNLDNKLKIENDARRELEEQLECVRREMESSMADKMKAERQCQESQTKLNVLSSYFKDKELQLQRELGEQEALKKQNLSKLDNADENTRTLEKELELSRQQAESLKRELTASERDFRSQIAANEKKAHENWLNARAAERELKECRHEAAVLRQKLTDVERRHMEPGLIRPLPTRGMPPPGMLNGPPPPGMERSPSRGSLPPGVIPPGGPPPPFREGEYAMSPRDLERLPPSHPARHMQPPPEARSPPPRMLPPDSRASPPRMMPLDGRSPPPYDRRGPPGPPHPLDSRSPPMRMPPPDMVPPMRGPFPPHMGPPLPMGSPGLRMDSPRDRPGQGQSPYGRQPPSGGESRRHQSQV